MLDVCSGAVDLPGIRALMLTVACDHTHKVTGKLFRTLVCCRSFLALIQASVAVLTPDVGVRKTTSGRGGG